MAGGSAANAVPAPSASANAASANSLMAKSPDGWGGKHREFTPAQIEFLANIVRLYRGEAPEDLAGGKVLLEERFPDGVYRDARGLCRVATLAEIEAQGWSLNPGRYVGVAERDDGDDEDFRERLEALQEELERLNAEAHELEERISMNVAALLEVK